MLIVNGDKLQLELLDEAAINLHPVKKGQTILNISINTMRDRSNLQQKGLPEAMT